mmetsp:Transcript_15682/g.40247  ORF Transcript_15682/g.40247 Transcript_15682/m.40247 type:complete len:103 (-) Transcript_15682:869-1177(-)
MQRATAGLKYYGTGEAFLFRARPGPVSAWRWSRANKYFQLSSANFLAMGGGEDGGFGFWVDGELSRVASAERCDTFDTEESLFSATDAGLIDLEVWELVPRL